MRGVDPVVMRSGGARAWKDEISPFRMPSQRQRRHLQQVLDAMQQRFNEVVRSGRKKLLTKERTIPIAVTRDGKEQTVQYTEIEPLNGKIYLAEEALGFNLIDGIGYLDDAVDQTIELAKLENPKVVRYSPRKSLAAQLLGAEAGRWGPALNVRTLEELQTPRIMMLWKAE